MKNKKIGKLFYLIPGIFIIVGICILAAGIPMLTSAIRFKENGTAVLGVITKIESHHNSEGENSHTVYVSYEYGGSIYSDVRLNSYSSSMYEGKEITLYCDPDNPRRIKADSMLYFGPGILMGIGCIFMLVGGGILIPMAVRSLKRKKVRELGKSIYAVVEQIEYNANFSVNGAHPYVIYCTYRDDYKDVSYRFKSENLWSDPSEVFPVGSTIEVKVMENDYSSYYVNAEELDRRVIDYT